MPTHASKIFHGPKDVRPIEVLLYSLTDRPEQIVYTQSQHYLPLLQQF